MSVTASQIFVVTLLIVLTVIPLALAMFLLFYLLSLPLRRQERGRILLDLLSLDDTDNRSLASVIHELSQTRDRDLGARFHLLGAYLKEGQSFQEAVKRVPRLLPVEIQHILCAGEVMGDFRKVLPCCQALLNDAAQSVRLATNNYALLTLILGPSLVVMVLFYLGIWPKLLMLINDYKANALQELPFLVAFISENLPTMIAILAAIVLALIGSAIAYVGGPRLKRWIESGIPPLTDWVSLMIPWRRQRLQRNLTLMLGVLIDHGVPEDEALLLSAQCTGNRLIIRRARRAIDKLASGENLAEAIRHLDPAPELAWRLRLATRHQDGFRAALEGWWQCLHARAARQEFNAAQISTTLIVLFNGLITGAIAYTVFFSLTQIIEEGLLW